MNDLFNVLMQRRMQQPQQGQQPAQQPPMAAGAAAGQEPSMKAWMPQAGPSQSPIMTQLPQISGALSGMFGGGFGGGAQGPPMANAGETPQMGQEMESMPPMANKLPWMPKGPAMQGAPAGGAPVLPNTTPRIPTRAQRWNNGQQIQSAYANGWNPNPTLLSAFLKR